LLDTNILMFAVGRPHPHKPVCQQILARAREFELAVEALQEMLFVYSRRGQRTEGLLFVQDMRVLFPLVLPTTASVLDIACNLMRSHDFLKPRDALHAAHVFDRALTGIVSDDAVFDRIPGLQRFSPNSA